MSIYPTTFKTTSGKTEIGGVLVSELAKKYGTPLYVMDAQTVRDNISVYKKPLLKHYPNFLIAYAGKANLNIGLLNLMADEGIGVDVVSGGEIYTALKSRIKPENIVFHGNNKSIDELKLAMENNIRIVIDNEQEVDHIIALVKNGLKARVMIRLKPEIEAHTHEYIKTGQIDSKFGIDKENKLNIAKKLIDQDGIELLGIHGHIGSQIFDTVPFMDLVDIMVGHVHDIQTEFDITLPELNLGGGLGIQYVTSDDPPDISQAIAAMAQKLDQKCKEKNIKTPKLIIEPGRSIVGTAGVTLYTVGTIKEIPDIKTYLFVDGGMADNPRPIMYKSEYTYKIADKPDGPGDEIYTIAGKFCESGDVLAHDVALPKSEVGDVLIVFGTGAYNYAMSSNYNRFLKPEMILVDNGAVSTIVKRETYDDLIRNDG